jgi:hypothetical protein
VVLSSVSFLLGILVQVQTWPMIGMSLSPSESGRPAGRRSMNVHTNLMAMDRTKLRWIEEQLGESGQLDVIVAVETWFDQYKLGSTHHMLLACSIRGRRVGPIKDGGYKGSVALFGRARLKRACFLDMVSIPPLFPLLGAFSPTLDPILEEHDALETSQAPRQRQRSRRLIVPLATRPGLINVVQAERGGEGVETRNKVVRSSSIEGGRGLARMMDEDVVELGKVDGGEDASGREGSVAGISSRSFKPRLTMQFRLSFCQTRRRV